MKNTDSKYNFGFTAGALLPNEFDTVMQAINSYQAFVNREEKINPKILAVNAETAQARYLSEVTKRIEGLPIEILANYLSLDENQRRIVQFYSVCKRYHLIRDFMLEVVRDKWLNLDKKLKTDDFELFLFSKMDIHPEVEAISEKTRYKLSQVTLKMLKELGMLNKEIVKIEPVNILSLINKVGDAWFLDVLLLTEQEKMDYYD